jgi:hypothetical protein
VKQKGVEREGWSYGAIQGRSPMAFCIRAPKASEPYCLWKYGFPANLQSAWMTAGRVFWRMGPYFLATAATARMMRAMPRSSQKPKVRRKMRKEKRMEDSGSMAEIMLASVGRI